MNDLLTTAQALLKLWDDGMNHDPDANWAGFVEWERNLDKAWNELRQAIASHEYRGQAKRPCDAMLSAAPELEPKRADDGPGDLPWTY